MDLMFLGVTPVCRVARVFRETKDLIGVLRSPTRLNRAECEGHVEAERREAEAKAMSREDTRDAASADVLYDSAYESPAEKHQKDY